MPELIYIAPVVVFTPLINKLSLPIFVTLPEPVIVPEIRTPFFELMIKLPEVPVAPPVAGNPNLLFATAL